MKVDMFVCDFCGQENVKNSIKIIETIQEDNSPKYAILDLCDECFKKLSLEVFKLVNTEIEAKRIENKSLFLLVSKFTRFSQLRR